MHNPCRTNDNPRAEETQHGYPLFFGELQAPNDGDRQKQDDEIQEDGDDAEGKHQSVKVDACIRERCKRYPECFKWSTVGLSAVYNVVPFKV